MKINNNRNDIFKAPLSPKNCHLARTLYVYTIQGHDQRTITLVSEPLCQSLQHQRNA